VALMFLASALFSIMSALVKAVGSSFPFPELVMLRGGLGLLLLLPLVRLRGVPFRPQNYKLLIARGLLGSAAMLGYFYALQRGLFADIAVLSRLQPVLIAILSPLVIKERVPRIAIVSLGLSLLGVLLVLRPSARQGIELASLAALGAAMLSALAHLSVRRLNVTDHPLVIVTVFSLITGSSGALAGVGQHLLPSAPQWLLIGGIALSATLAQLLMTTAYGRERAAVVAAAGYMNIVYALVLGWVFWREWPSPVALGGAGLIIFAGMLLAIARHGVREPPAAG
jgi:drug/metabolite transporter (DMT)-like permease